MATNRWLHVLKLRAKRLPKWVRAPLKRFSTFLQQLENLQYAKWIEEYDSLSLRDVEDIRRRIEKLTYRPLISVVMPTYNTAEWALRDAIQSVLDQLYENLELCVADDASPSLHVVRVLEEFAAKDPRVKWMRRSANGSISAASNSAIAIASGEFVALMDHDDLLSKRALYEVAVVLNENPRLDVIYTDEDIIDRFGYRGSPYFKTDINRALLLAHNLISHLGVYRRSLVQEVGGFQIGLEGSQDYDLALRCIDATHPTRIHHIPDVLYHWRRDYGPPSFSEQHSARCSAAARQAIANHLDRRDERGEVRPHPSLPSWTRVVRKLPSPIPLVSVIVPTLVRANLQLGSLQELLDQTDYGNFELLIVEHRENAAKLNRLSQAFQADPRVSIIPYAGEPNHSAIYNFAAASARGTILALLSVEIEVISADWLSEMVSWAVLNDVGAVGAKLLEPTGLVTNSISVLGPSGAGNSSQFLPKEAPGYFGRNLLTSEVSAVSGACLAIRKSIFVTAGGFDEQNLPSIYNDVDLCLRLRRLGYRIIWNAHAEVLHHATLRKSDIARHSEKEEHYMARKWQAELAVDPFYNINLSLDPNRLFQLAFPPRRRRSWISTD